MKFLRFLWEWTPPDIWENPPAFLTRWQESLFLWIGRQVSEVVKMLGSLLLSFPTHFIETPGFQQLYSLVTVVALVFLPAMLAYRFIRAVMGERRWAFLNQQDIILFIVRFLILTAVVLRAPQLFVVFSSLANRIVASFLDMGDFTLVVQPYGLELIIVGLLITIVFYALRLIIYYAVRNFQLVTLLLTTPFVLVRWVIFGDSGKVESWLNQLLSLVVVQVLHAFLLIVLTRLMALEPSPETSGKVSKLWAAMVQIGAMELMLRPQIILGNILSYQPVDEPTHIRSKVRSATGKIKKLVGGGTSD